MNKKFSLTIGWLYPELMSTYGDRGNIITLQKRSQWRKIEVKTSNLDFSSLRKDYERCDIFFGGGAQDRQQAIVISDLLDKKSILQKLFENNIPGLFVCGSPQLLGHYYETASEQKLPGLGIFDIITKSGHDKPRLIGNLVARVDNKFMVHGNANSSVNREPESTPNYIVGFENHAGRTYLGGKIKPFARVVKGFGNNGEDGTEGAVYKNVIATYSHGPFLPKNSHIADWLIKTALEVKYQKEIQLEPLDDTLEWQAHNYILKKMGI